MIMMIIVVSVIIISMVTIILKLYVVIAGAFRYHVPFSIISA